MWVSSVILAYTASHGSYTSRIEDDPSWVSSISASSSVPSSEVRNYVIIDMLSRHMVDMKDNQNILAPTLTCKEVSLIVLVVFLENHVLIPIYCIISGCVNVTMRIKYVEILNWIKSTRILPSSMIDCCVSYVAWSWGILSCIAIK
jgi:hypothetical protein